MELRFPCRCDNVRNAVLFADARENETNVTRAVRVRLDMHALVAATKFAAGVRPQFLDDVAVLAVESDEAFEGLFAI